jgi:ectoine hydroxylase-related dioxygenase (phytanoyl-CoA dioxygenase family)
MIDRREPPRRDGPPGRYDRNALDAGGPSISTPETRRAFYGAEGFLIRHEQPLDPVEFSQLQGLYQKHNQLGTKLDGIHFRDPAIWPIVLHENLVKAAEEILETDNIDVYGVHLIAKAPRTDVSTPAHTDRDFWVDRETGMERLLKGEDPRVVTLWLALYPSNPANGGMKFVAESHLLPPSAFKYKKVEDPRKSLFHYEIESVYGDPLDIYTKDAVPFVLEAGEYSLHDDNGIHLGGPNTTNDERVGLAIRYMPASTRLNPDHQEYATYNSLLHASGKPNPQSRYLNLAA